MVLESNVVAENLIKEAEVQTKKKVPTLAIVSAGDDPGLVSYIKSIKRVLCPAGVNIQSIESDDDIECNHFLERIAQLNWDKRIDAILVLKPYPETVDSLFVEKLVSPTKDVDGITPNNLGYLAIGDSNRLVPATALGIVELLDHYDIDVKSKNVVIVNNSPTIGKPLALILTDRFATVTLCHEYTKDLSEYTKNADIVITAAGVSNLIKPDMVKNDAIIIDAGVSFDDEAGHLVGDMDPACNTEERKVCSLSPGCGGGIGPITTASLLLNAIKCSNLK